MEVSPVGNQTLRTPDIEKLHCRFEVFHLGTTTQNYNRYNFVKIRCRKRKRIEDRFLKIFTSEILLVSIHTKSRCLTISKK